MCAANVKVQLHIIPSKQSSPLHPGGQTHFCGSTHSLGLEQFAQYAGHDFVIMYYEQIPLQL